MRNFRIYLVLINKYNVTFPEGSNYSSFTEFICSFKCTWPTQGSLRRKRTSLLQYLGCTIWRLSQNIPCSLWTAVPYISDELKHTYSVMGKTVSAILPDNNIDQRALFLLWNITIKTMCFSFSCECSSNTSDYKAHLEADHAENNPTFLQTSWFVLDTSDFLSHNTVLTILDYIKTPLWEIWRDLHMSVGPALLPLCLLPTKKKPLLISQAIQSHHNRYDLGYYLFVIVSLASTINSCICIQHNNSMPPSSAYLDVDLETPTGLLINSVPYGEANFQSCRSDKW